MNALPLLAAFVALAAGASILALRPAPEPRSAVVEAAAETPAAFREELELRGGRLFRPGAAAPFAGRLIERHPDGRLRVEIEIADGRAHGRARGWHANGAPEVEEFFVEGVSHGRRRRWHDNGQLRSECEIVRGEITGTFREWHANGALAATVDMRGGRPAGPARRYDPQGALLAVRGGLPHSAP